MLNNSTGPLSAAMGGRVPTYPRLEAAEGGGAKIETCPSPFVQDSERMPRKEKKD